MKLSRITLGLGVVVTVLVVGLLMASCGSDTTGPSEPGQWFGWAVGASVDSYGFIIATGDGGVNWNRQGSGSDIPNVQLECVRALDSLTAWVVGDVASGYGTILKTLDGGATWIRQGSSTYIPAKGLNGISLLDGNTAFVVGMDNTILYTSDGGSIWVSMADPAYDGFDYDCVYAVNHSVIWVVGGTEHYGIILRSPDGGNTWESQGDSLLLDEYPLICVSAIDASNAWVVGHGYTVASTSNGGSSWELKVPEGLSRNPLSDDANGVCALQEDWVLVTMDYGKAYLTENGAQTWTEQNIPSSDYLLGTCALDTRYAWIAGLSASSGAGSILNTSNGGQDWSFQGISGCLGLRDVSFVNAHH